MEHERVPPPLLLSAVERDWLEQDEALWREAHRLAERHPHLDVSGLYHTLVNLRRTPSERLRRGLAHARLRPR